VSGRTAFTETCGCTFCDLGLAPDLVEDGRPYHYAPDRTTKIQCSRPTAEVVSLTEARQVLDDIKAQFPEKTAWPAVSFVRTAELAPRLIKKDEARRFLGLRPSLFDVLVRAKRVPGPTIGGLWDTHALRRVTIDPGRGCVYFVRCGKFIKVGYTDQEAGVGLRVESFTTGNPFDIDVLHTERGSLQWEAMFHAAFQPWHHRGEWFRLAGLVKAYLLEVGAEGVK
jgi:hypothetical protein